jgi:hypothetical protein
MNVIGGGGAVLEKEDSMSLMADRALSLLRAER